MPGALELRRIEKLVKMHYTERSDLPPTATPMPGAKEAICSSPNTELPARPETDWTADPGWAAIGFTIEGPSRVSYSWTRTSATTGFATSDADLDCDGIYRSQRVDIAITPDGMTATYSDPTDD